MSERIEQDTTRIGFTPAIQGKKGEDGATVWRAMLMSAGTEAWSCEHQHQAWEDAADCAELRRQFVLSRGGSE